MEHQPLAKANAQPEAQSSVRPVLSPDESIHPILRQQQLIGNRAVGRQLQAKLKISQPGDLHEQEADRVADEVMRMTDPGILHKTAAAPLVQRACADCEEVETQRKEVDEEEEEDLQAKLLPGGAAKVGGDNLISSGQHGGTGFAISHDTPTETVNRNAESPYSIADGRTVAAPEEERKEEPEEEVQAKSAGGVTAAAVPSVSASIEAAVSRPGSALSDSTRTFMESRFRHDFSGVRIHTDEVAATAAESVNARAFTRGDHVVFGRGQYSPSSESGRWLLAHEFTHVIQQGSAPGRRSNVSPQSISRSTPSITRHGPDETVRRVKWNTARDTGEDTMPWNTGPNGDVYRVQTDAGNIINAWKPHDSQMYWCHGYTFGGSAATNGPFSIWGESVPTVLQDDGWKPAYSCMAQRGDALVFAANNVAHSGRVASTSEPSGTVDETASMLNSKWGQLPFNTQSWAVNARTYGRYGVYSQNPATGVCSGKGTNER